MKEIWQFHVRDVCHFVHQGEQKGIAGQLPRQQIIDLPAPLYTPVWSSSSPRNTTASASAAIVAALSHLPYVASYPAFRHRCTSSANHLFPTALHFRSAVKGHFLWKFLL